VELKVERGVHIAISDPVLKRNDLENEFQILLNYFGNSYLLRYCSKLNETNFVRLLMSISTV
jgi:hypothetical protein